MNSMMEVTTQDPHMHTAPQSISPTAMRYRIKRNGGRPLVFDGSELAMAMSYSSDISFWYEINFYRTVEQGFVTAVRIFHQSEDRQDTVTAWEADTLDEAIAQLTAYDAAQDVHIPVDLDLPSLAPAETAALGLQLNARVAEHRKHFQYLVGEFLYDLEHGS